MSDKQFSQLIEQIQGSSIGIVVMLLALIIITILVSRK